MSHYMFDQKPALDELEHAGVKGMKWGVRKAVSGAKRTGRFAQRHPRAVGATLAGAAFAARLIRGNEGRRLVSVALPNATMMDRNGDIFSIYGPGAPQIRRVRVRDIAALNAQYGATRR